MQTTLFAHWLATPCPLHRANVLQANFVNEPVRGPARGDGATIFILSFHQRDELAAKVVRAGWVAIAARRKEGAERRFFACAARVAVVDARGAYAPALAAVKELGAAVAGSGAALLVLADEGDDNALSALFEAGATHFLLGEVSEHIFAHSLRFAARHADRLAGDWAHDHGSRAPLGWRYDLAEHALLLSPALASLLSCGERVSLRPALGGLSSADRRTAFAAIRRLMLTGQATAFAYDVPGKGRFVAHVRISADLCAIDAAVERLTTAEDAAPRPRGAHRPARDMNSARRWLDARLAQTAAEPLNTALVALNRFDIVNTAYGRVAGDSLLRIALRRIEEAASELIGDDGIVARMGGSEFLLAAKAPVEQFEVIASNIAEALARPFVANSAVVVLGCRIGCAVAEAQDDNGTLLRRTSEALAEARASDSRSIVFSRDMGAHGTAIDRLAVDLHQAIAAGQIGVLFQPQVAVSTGAIVGVEALARWEHPLLGPIGAEALFAAAERADMVIGLSDHIQKIALERAAAWPAVLGGLRLAINLTAADITRPGFADIFIDRVDSSGFARNRLSVEVTEGGLIDDLGVAAALLAQLRWAGCRVAIDDFGTGYSSLAYLKALPLDYLKIDKKLAQDIAGTPRDRIVVRGVIDMARSLGLSVIAEGVETPEQLDLLAKEGCQYYQGFLCAGALDEAELVALLARATPR